MAGKSIEVGHQAADSYKAVLTTFPNLELRRTNFSIADLASDLRVRYRIGAPEAIQIATAIVEGAGAYLCDDPNLSRIVEPDIVLLRDLQGVGRGMLRPHAPMRGFRDEGLHAS